MQIQSFSVSVSVGFSLQQITTFYTLLTYHLNGLNQYTLPAISYQIGPEKAVIRPKPKLHLRLVNKKNN